MTTTILIICDLNTQGQDYEDLIKKINSVGLWWHHPDSTWTVKTSQSAKSVRDELKPLLGTNDELLVIEITDDLAAWHGFNNKGKQWLKNYIGSGM